MPCRIAQDDPGFFILLAEQELMCRIAGTVQTATRLSVNKSPVAAKKSPEIGHKPEKSLYEVPQKTTISVVTIPSIYSQMGSVAKKIREYVPHT